MIERFTNREQAEQRAEYLRIGMPNTYVEERDMINRWTDKVEHCFVVVKVK